MRILPSYRIVITEVGGERVSTIVLSRIEGEPRTYEVYCSVCQREERFKVAVEALDKHVEHTLGCLDLSEKAED